MATRSYDITATADGECNPSRLTSEMRTAFTLDRVQGASVDLDPAFRAVGSEIEVYFDPDIAGGEIATAAAVIAAHNGDVSPTGGVVQLAPTPASNTWADIPGAEFSIAEETLVTGQANILCFVGPDYEPCGATTSFAASRATGLSAKVESWGVPGGRVAQFETQLVGVGSDTVRVQIRRRGTADIRVRVDLDFTAEAVP